MAVIPAARMGTTETVPVECRTRSRLPWLLVRHGGTSCPTAMATALDASGAIPSGSATSLCPLCRSCRRPCRLCHTSRLCPPCLLLRESEVRRWRLSPGELGTRARCGPPRRTRSTCASAGGWAWCRRRWSPRPSRCPCLGLWGPRSCPCLCPSSRSCSSPARSGR